MITNTELADELIQRLNQLIEDPAVCQDASKIIETRIPCSFKTLTHPTIQAAGQELGFLGLLNGIVGIIGEGPKAQWGFITAEFEGEDPTPGNIVKFKRTE